MPAMDALSSSDVLVGGAGSDGARAVVPSLPQKPAARPEASPARASEAAPLSMPPEPSSLTDSGLPYAELESLVLKILLQRGACAGSVVSEVACMPRSIIAETLDRIRTELLVTIKSSS